MTPSVTSQPRAGLFQGISVILIDIVTNRRANLHNDVLGVMDAPDTLNPEAGCQLYAVAYRPVRLDGRDEIDIGRSRLGLGGPLPELPLGLSGGLVIAVDFETTFEEVCRRTRLIGS